MELSGQSDARPTETLPVGALCWMAVSWGWVTGLSSVYLCIYIYIYTKRIHNCRRADRIVLRDVLWLKGVKHILHTFAYTCSIICICVYLFMYLFIDLFTYFLHCVSTERNKYARLHVFVLRKGLNKLYCRKLWAETKWAIFFWDIVSPSKNDIRLEAFLPKGCKWSPWTWFYLRSLPCASNCVKARPSWPRSQPELNELRAEAPRLQLFGPSRQTLW